MDFPQPLPSEVSDAGDMARQLALLLGPAYQPGDGTFIAQDLLALGGLLAGYPWTGVVSITGSSGATITFGGSQLLYNGVLYGNFTTALAPFAPITSVTLNSHVSAGTGWFACTALRAGAATNRNQGDVLLWTSTPSGSSATATVVMDGAETSDNDFVSSPIPSHTIAAGANSGRSTNLASVSEAFVDTALQLLTEFEVEYGLQIRTDLAPSQRQNRLLAKLRAKFSGTPQDIATSISIIPSSYKLAEVLCTSITGSEYGGSPFAPYYRNSMNFNIVIAPSDFAYAGSLNLTMQSIVTLIEQMKPAHTTYVITTNDISAPIPFDTSDPSSLTDRNVLAH